MSLRKKSGKDISIVHSSAAEYLTFVAPVGKSETSIEMRYEDENIWLTQKMMATLYDVSIPAINQHLKRILDDNELEEASVIKHYLTTASDGKNIIPLQKRGIIAYDVLNPGQLKKYLNADWSIENPMNYQQLLALFKETNLELQQRAARSVDTSLVIRNWLFGWYIVEFEQGGSDRAEYGANLLKKIAGQLKLKGCSERSLALCCKFYLTYSGILQALPAKSSDNSIGSKGDSTDTACYIL